VTAHACALLLVQLPVVKGVSYLNVSVLLMRIWTY